jgi:mRNA interferase RelE/StbE
LPVDPRVRVLEAMFALGDEPRPRGTKKLKNRGLWRIRVGSYRIIYAIFDAERLVKVEAAVRRTTTTYD